MFTVETLRGDIPFRIGIVSAENVNTPNNHRPILYVPGLGGSIKTVIPFLEGLLPTVGPIYGLDPRGVGLNQELSTAGMDLKPYLNDLRMAYGWVQERHNGIHPIVMGLSMGGIFASLLQANNTEGKGLILLAPAFRPHPKAFSVPYRIKSLATMVAFAGQVKIKLPYAIKEITRNPVKCADPALQEPGQYLPQHLFAIEKVAKMAMQSLVTVTIPSFVLVPEADIVCDPAAMQEAYDKIGTDNKKINYYPGFYHDLTLEPEEHIIQRDIIQWINLLKN